MSPNDHDLVVIALSGVQAFITESRTTMDLCAASQIVARLVERAVDHLAGDHGAEMVFPQHPGNSEVRRREAQDGMPNRVVALLPGGTGPVAARSTHDLVTRTWESWVRAVFDQQDRPTPGWPTVQWVSVPVDSSYEDAWTTAQRALAARKNTRDFVQPTDDGVRELCVLSPRWRSVDPPSEVKAAATTGRYDHLRSENLATANWVKRFWHRKSGEPAPSGFPSTHAIASGPFRRGVLERYSSDKRVADAVQFLEFCATTVTGKDTDNKQIPERPMNWPGVAHGDDVTTWFRGLGARWVYPEAWHVESLAQEFPHASSHTEFIDTVRAGREASLDLITAMRSQPVRFPDPHLAVLVQDLDFMGSYLSGREKGQDGKPLKVSVENHTNVSRLLSEIAREQSEIIRSFGGTVVYAGGDDLLALVPASVALDAAQACHDSVPEQLPTASTGLSFFHNDSPLQQAVQRGQELLAKAKERRDKHALGVGVLRNSGARFECVLNWSDDPGPLRALRVFTRRDTAFHVRVTPGLLNDVQAEHRHLNPSTPDQPGEVLPVYAARKELRRLVRRHTRTESVDGGATGRDRGTAREAFVEDTATALEWMAPARDLVSADAVRVALFLLEEA
ncbi:type III-B CRISPR-associated protein Cas10/Cmr2 [Nocardiopsis sp. NPDC006938]|uniref:Cas10/Cmr2 second palm domain-containing protein n=1 Tax=Nocardiopsis sp. NPDC006938 TaxID=3364337 RepID=UPI0036814AD1